MPLWSETFGAVQKRVSDTGVEAKTYGVPGEPEGAAEMAKWNPT